MARVFVVFLPVWGRVVVLWARSQQQAEVVVALALVAVASALAKEEGVPRWRLAPQRRGNCGFEPPFARSRTLAMALFGSLRTRDQYADQQR